MPQRQVNTLRKEKKIIRVFCEGESEQAYTDFLKCKFSDVAVIKYPKELGLFDVASDRFTKDPQYREYINEIDEVWFFFDVEVKDIPQWDKRIKIIKSIRKLRRKPNIKVRLVMTTGCIEYWFMLHFKKYAPPLQTVEEKNHVIEELVQKVPTYKKGDRDSTCKIAEKSSKAISNAKSVFSNLISEGLPCLDDTDERNQWLCKNCFTFSNVFEALEFLQNL